MPKSTDGKEKVREHDPRQTRGGLTPSFRSGGLSRGAGWPLARMRSEFDRLFDDFFRGWGLSAMSEERQSSWGLDVDDQPDKIVVRADAPGFEPDEFDLQVHDDQLVLCACASEERKEEGRRQWHQQELYRSIPLPSGVDAERVDAHYKNGVLTVTLPKTERAKSRKIEVKT
jgi:HSP20 family protein